MTQEQTAAKIAKNYYKTSQYLSATKALKEMFLKTIVSYSNNLPDWGNLNIIVK